jgi:transposase
MLVDDNWDRTTVLQKMFNEAGIPLLTLPVHHPELNPIEMYWGYAKNKVGATYHNVRKFSEVKKLVVQYLNEGAEKCAEKWYWKSINSGTEYWHADVKEGQLAVE